MKTSDFDYLLPAELIAQQPLDPRDSCRMAVLDRKTGEHHHTQFRELAQWLREGDCLVFNNSRVLPCRLPCVKEGGGAAVEVFVLRPDLLPAFDIEVMLRPIKRLKVGTRLTPAINAPLGNFEVRAFNKGTPQTATLRWIAPGPLEADTLLRCGVMPLPPYIQREKFPSKDQQNLDTRFYQTVFAQAGASCAAPTAGLHFSENVLQKIRAKGVEIQEITLNVGAGTFAPVKTDTMEEHQIHRESFEISDLTAQKLTQAKSQGRRIVAVGTTSLRTLESAYKKGIFEAGAQETQLFILPGYSFKATDALFTNFHQPRSTLLALVRAFAHPQNILDFYSDCVSRQYRFLSYGDCTFIQ